MFTSILNAHQATYAPQFWNKKIVKDYLEEHGIPFVSLRPGAFIDQGQDFTSGGVRKGQLMAYVKPDVRFTHVLTEDLARYLAMAVDAPEAVGKRIDIVP